MDDFLRSINEIEKVEDKSKKTDMYVALFQKMKYTKGEESVILLLKMISLFEDQFQIYYHLFNHFLMMKMYEEAIKFVSKLEDEPSRINEIAQKYPLFTGAQEKLLKLFNERKGEDIINFINKYEPRLPNNELGAKYFAISVKMRDAGIKLIPETYFNKAISLSKGKAKVKMILTFCATLVKMGKKQNAKNILSSEINNSSDKDSMPLMYKLATLYEDEGSDNALALYREIEKIDPDFLDTKERISKLTNIQNSCIIKHYLNLF